MISPTSRLINVRDWRPEGERLSGEEMTLERAMELMEKWKTMFPNNVQSFDYEAVERRVLDYVVKQERGE